MNELTPAEKKLIERAEAFADKIDETYIIETMGMDGVAPISRGLFSNGKAMMWIAIVGLENALRMAFCLGAAWERELHEGNSPGIERLLDDVELKNLDEGEYKNDSE